MNTRATASRSTAPTSRSARFVAAVADAWSDVHYASKRIVELRTGPIR